MERLAKFISSKLGYRVDPDLVIAYRSAIPSQIDVRVDRHDNHLVGRIVRVDEHELPKEVVLVTEAKTNDELVNMFNDLIFAYKRIPELYRPYFKGTLKPVGGKLKTESLTLVKA